MTTEYVVYTEFRGKDNLSPALAGMSSNFNTFANKTSKGLELLTSKGHAVRDIMQGVFAGAILMRGAAALRTGIQGAISDYALYDQAMIKVLSNTDKFAKKGDAAWVSMRDNVRKLATETKFSLVDVAEGASNLAQAGLKDKSLNVMLEQSAYMANASGSTVDEASGNLIEISGAYGMGRKSYIDDGTEASKLKAEEDYGKGIVRINNTLATVMRDFSVDMSGLASMMRKSGAVGSLAQGGPSSNALEDSAVLGGFLGESGIKNQVSGTTLKNMNTRIIEAAQGLGKGENGKMASKMMKKIGFVKEDVIDEKGNNRGMIDVLGNMAGKMQAADMSNTESLAMLRKIFGMYALTGTAIGINYAKMEGGLAKMKKVRDDLVASNQRGDNEAKVISKGYDAGMGNKLDILWNQATELKTKILESQDALMGSYIDDATKWLKELDPQPFKDAFKGFADGVKYVIENKDTLIALAKSFLVYKGIMTGAGMLASGAMTLQNIGAFMSAGTSMGTAAASALTGAAPLMGVGIANVLAGTLYAGAIGAAIGYSIWQYMDSTDKKADRGEKRFYEKTDELRQLFAATDGRVATPEERKKRVALQGEIDKAQNDMNGGVYNSLEYANEMGNAPFASYAKEAEKARNEARAAFAKENGVNPLFGSVEQDHAGQIAYEKVKEKADKEFRREKMKGTAKGRAFLAAEETTKLGDEFFSEQRSLMKEKNAETLWNKEFGIEDQQSFDSSTNPVAKALLELLKDSSVSVEITVNQEGTVTGTKVTPKGGAKPSGATSAGSKPSPASRGQSQGAI